MLETLRASFLAHLEIRLAAVAGDLEKTRFSALVLAAGAPSFYFRDDQPAPFRANPHFLHFCPLEAPHHLLLIQRGRKPRLIAHCPEDFWYESLPIGDPFWAEGFRIVECRSRKEQIAALVSRLPAGRTAWLGEAVGGAEAMGLVANPPALVNRLDWRRALKTPYEVDCISEANRRGAVGHRAAEAAFREGGSELDIHRAFVSGVGALEADLPYPTIVALNEKGAVLHYEGKRPEVRNGASLLLDAGARVRGYASDITRTRAGEAASPAFRSLVGAMEEAQQELVAAVRPGRPWAEVQMRSHLVLARVLREQGIIRCPPETAVETGLSRAFFPHGLGHFLGIQVHDVGGHLAGPDGREAPPPASQPALRTTRVLEPGHVITVEPGIYFIGMLLAPWRGGSSGRRQAVNWDAVDELAPFGGVRIEDDVLVTPGAPRNLTREHLPD